MLEERLRQIVRETELIDYLRALRSVDIPHAWVIAGAVRNTVWKTLFPQSTLEVNDIDVAYFSKDLVPEMDEAFARELETIYPTGKCECSNQAWVHEYRDQKYVMPHAPYDFLEESIQDFWFSVNTIGLRLNDDDEIEILYSEALEDLFSGILRVLPEHTNNQHEWFRDRIEKIISRCPQVRVLDYNADDL